MVEEKKEPDPYYAQQIEDWKRNLETSRKLRGDKEPQSLNKPETEEIRSNFLNTESLQIIGKYKRISYIKNCSNIPSL